MDILTVINLLGLIFLFIYLFKDKLKIQSGFEDELGFYKFDENFTEYEKKLLTKIHKKFFKYSNEYVSLDVLYAVLWKEAGGQIFNDKQNYEIVGDGGNSIGYMQVNRFGALPEYNHRQNSDYSFEDLKDEAINIKIGTAYLYYAQQKALKISKNKPYQWLMFKMYNGGLGETETSNNQQANNYADDCYNKFLKVNKFINLNFS